MEDLSKIIDEVMRSPYATKLLLILNLVGVIYATRKQTKGFLVNNFAIKAVIKSVPKVLMHKDSIETFEDSVTEQENKLWEDYNRKQVTILPKLKMLGFILLCLISVSVWYITLKRFIIH